MEAKTLLAAARLAYPLVNWIEDDGFVFNLSSSPDDLEYFNITNPADAHALMLALMRNGFTFEYDAVRESYLSGNFEIEAQHEHVDFPALLLTCVETLEAMK